MHDYFSIKHKKGLTGAALKNELLSCNENPYTPPYGLPPLSAHVHLNTQRYLDLQEEGVVQEVVAQPAARLGVEDGLVMGAGGHKVSAAVKRR